MTAVIVVCIVSAVDSEAERFAIDGGLKSAARAEDPGELRAGDGRELCREDVEKADKGDSPAAVGVDNRLSSLGQEDRIQEAKAAR